jgi:hypothetical protein
MSCHLYTANTVPAARAKFYQEKAGCCALRSGRQAGFIFAASMTILCAACVYCQAAALPLDGGKESSVEEHTGIAVIPIGIRSKSIGIGSKQTGIALIQIDFASIPIDIGPFSFGIALIPVGNGTIHTGIVSIPTENVVIPM